MLLFRELIIKLVAAAQDNEKLKIHLKQVLNTDMAKENRGLRKS